MVLNFKLCQERSQIKRKNIMWKEPDVSSLVIEYLVL